MGLIQSEIRIEWAGKKLDELKHLISVANDDTIEAVSREGQPDWMRIMFRFQDQTHYESIRLVSEFLYHSRSALDYVIFNPRSPQRGS